MLLTFAFHLGAFVAGAIQGEAPAARSSAATITQPLRAAMDSAAPGARVRAYAVLTARPDPFAYEAELATLARRERGARLGAHLRVHDAANRASLLAYLEGAERDGEAGDVLDLFVVNVVAFSATPRRIEEIARLAGIDTLRIDAEARVPTEDSVRADAGPPAEPTMGPCMDPGMAVIVAPHVVKIGADQCWSLGQIGQGSVVSIIDKGIALNHPSLKNHFWVNPNEIAGNLIDDDGNGFVDDVNGWNFEFRNNNVNTTGGFDHGTKVAGLVVGDGTLADAVGSQYVTGVAPGAQILSMVFGNFQSQYWACQQYSILQGVDVILSSHSWKWDLAAFPDYALFRALADIELVAGILHVNSAGNQGGDPTFPVPYNIAAPANCPAPWRHPNQVSASKASTLAVGAVNLNDSFFSQTSVGPAAWEDVKLTSPGYPHLQNPAYWDYPFAGGVKPGLLKPDVCGISGVITTTLDSFYSFNFIGSSAAAPQVAGLAALMYAANSHLEPRHVAHLLQSTATDLGAPGKDVVFGAGRIQAFEAVKRSFVSVKPIPTVVKLMGTVAIECRTVPTLPTYVVIGAIPGETPLAGIGTLDIVGPYALLVDGLTSPLADFTAAALTIPNEPALVGLAFYLQLAVTSGPGPGATWVLSAVDGFVITP